MGISVFTRKSRKEDPLGILIAEKELGLRRSVDGSQKRGEGEGEETWELRNCFWVRR